MEASAERCKWCRGLGRPAELPFEARVACAHLRGEAESGERLGWICAFEAEAEAADRLRALRAGMRLGAGARKAKLARLERTSAHGEHAAEAADPATLPLELIDGKPRGGSQHRRKCRRERGVGWLSDVEPGEVHQRRMRGIDHRAPVRAARE